MLVNNEHTASDLSLADTAININNLSEISDLFFISNDFVFNTQSDFETQSVWQNGIGQGYIIPIHDIKEVEDNSESEQYNLSNQDFQYKVSDGKSRYRFKAKYDISYFQDLQDYDQSYYTVCLYDGSNLYGILNGSQVTGIDTDLISIPKVRLQIGNTPSWTDIYIEFSNFNDLLVSPITWNASYLKNIEVTIQNVTQTTDITFEIVDSCGVTIEGLTTSDITITDTVSGAAVNSVFTEDGNGYYTIDTDITLYYGTITMFNTEYNGTGVYSFSTPQYNPTQYNNSQYST